MTKKDKALMIALASIGLLVTGVAGFNYFVRLSDINFYKKFPKEDWTKTASGRYAHSLKYEDKLAKPVPYNISSPSIFTTDEQLEKRSEEYFEHLCNTEAGNYVWKTAEPQTSIALLRTTETPSGSVRTSNSSNGELEHNPITIDDYNKVRDGWEAPGLVNYFFAMRSEVQKQGHENVIIGLNDYFDFMLNYSYPYINYEVWFNFGNIVKYSKTIQVEKESIISVKLEDKLTSRYGITWRGFSRPHDREYGIAGEDLIIVDLQNNEVIAVQRNFAKAHINNGIYNWYFPLKCFDLYKNNINKKINYPLKSSFYEKLQIIKNEDVVESIQKPFLLDVLPSTLITKSEHYTGYEQENLNAKKIDLKNKGKQ